MDSTTTFQTARLAAPALSFALSGGSSTVSLMTIPAFLSAPSQIAAQQFALIYKIGAKTQPPLTLLTALTHGFVAYCLYSTGNGKGSWKYWATSGALVGAILPWTFALMEPVSHRALKLAESDGKGMGDSVKGKGSEEIFGLLKKWNGFNMVRAALAFAAGAVAMMRI